MMDTSFLVGNAPQPLLNPLDIQAKRNALALQSQAIQQNSLALESTKRQLAADAAFRSLFQSAGAAPSSSADTPAPAAPSVVSDGVTGSMLPGAPAYNPTPATNSVVSDGVTGAMLPGAPAYVPAASGSAGAPSYSGNVPTAAHDISDDQILGIYGQQGYGLIHARNEANKLAAEAKNTRAEAQQKVNDYFGSLAFGVQSVGFDPGAVQAALAKAKADGMQSTPEFQMFAANAQSPQALRQLAAQAIANSPEQQKLLNERTTAAAAKSKANTDAQELTLKTPSLTTNADGLTPSQQSEHDLRAAEIAKLNTPAELAFIASHPGPDQATAKAALELLKQNNIEERKASQQPIINLTPDAQAMLANNYAQTGNMPSIPRGQGGAIVAGVLNQAAATNPGVNLGANRASYKADSGALVALQKQRDVVGAFEQTASKNLDMFLNLAKKIPDTGVPWLNLPLRMVDQKLVGDANMSAVNAARNVANNEIAKVTSNPGLAGALSDSARHEVAEYNPANATYAQTLAVAKVLRQDMANRPAALDEAIKQVKARLGASAAVPHDVPPVGGTFNGQKVLSVTRIE